MATIRIATSYPYSIERVWFALTDARALSEWLMPTRDFEPRLGHRFQFYVESPKRWKTVVDCEVVELVALQRRAFTWQTDLGRPGAGWIHACRGRWNRSWYPIDTRTEWVPRYGRQLHPSYRHCGSPKNRPHVVAAINADSDQSAIGIFDEASDRISNAERLSRRSSRRAP